MNFGITRPGVFRKTVTLKFFAKFTGKYLCRSLFRNRVVDWRPEALLKDRFWHRRFLVNFAKKI